MVAVVLAGVYILFMLLPFMQEAQTETRRIAELLSQLPPELDVESMVMRTLAATRPRGSGLGVTSRAQSGGASASEWGLGDDAHAGSYTSQGQPGRRVARAERGGPRE